MRFEKIIFLYFRTIRKKNDFLKEKIIKVYIPCNVEVANFRNHLKQIFCAFFEFAELLNFC